MSGTTGTSGSGVTNLVVDDDLLEVLQKAFNQYSPSKPEKSQKFNIPAICGAVGAALLVGIAGTVALVSRSSLPQQISAEEIAQKKMLDKRFAYLELLTRVDRSPNALDGAGMIQQANAMYANQIVANVNQQRNDPSHPNYRVSLEAGLTDAETNAYELLLFAANGKQATLSFYSEDGTEVISRTITDAQLASIALNKLAAIDAAYTLESLPQPRLLDLATLTQNSYLEVKSARINLLKQRGLVDPAEQIEQVQMWQRKRKVPTAVEQKQETPTIQKTPTAVEQKQETPVTDGKKQE